MSKLSIAAVVVTFNRKLWLMECLDALLSQTVPLSHIYIVDNASTDGTEQALREASYLTHDQCVAYIRLAANTGGAGGFSAGMKAAFDAGFDWFWLMDDDVEAYPNALAELLRFCGRSECIHGRRSNPDGTPHAWGGYFHAKEHHDVSYSRSCSFPRTKTHKKLRFGCFEGMLISRKVVAQIGFPDARFFITWDDTFYGYLASRVTRVLYANVLVLKRKRAVDLRDFSLAGHRQLLSPLALYHFHRNRFLIAKALGTCSAAFWRMTAILTIRGVLRELIFIRSIGRAFVIARGAFDGVRFLTTS
jgi:rhamnopyranosyl-N-acetylglucosaminyl-diphospho-decaprenol beta-1,3/1,4-galactofuranosyltransferase